MKPKGQETSAKTHPGQTAKDVLPPTLLGRQREPVAVKRPQAEDLGEKAQARHEPVFVEKHFAEWTATCEHVDPGKPFREDNYDYFRLEGSTSCVWKRATDFFRILETLKSRANETVFRKFCDDFVTTPKRKKFDGLFDDTQVNYVRTVVTNPPQVQVCGFEEEEETDAAFAARQAEFDRDFKPKPGQKKPVLVG